MTFSTDWDVEKYRVEHECDDHWELRRRFLVEHKDKFPEERLVCLAQVFYNVEFYGCRYPEKTMRLVAELSQGVADDHREKMKSKLQRTFVQASDAASTKVKGRSRNEGTAPKPFKPINFQKSNERNPLSMDSLNLKEENSQETDSVPEETVQMETAPEPSNVKSEDSQQDPSIEKPKRKKNRKKKPKKKQTALDPSAPSDGAPGRFVLADQSRFEHLPPDYKRPNEDLALAGNSKRLKPIGHSIFSKLVLMESAGTNPYGVLSRSTGAAHMQLKQENKKTAGGTEVTLSVGNEILSQATAASAEEAKAQCAAQGLAKLKKLCYTVFVKDRLAGSVVDKQDVSDNSSLNKTETPEHLAEDSKANRMMKLMGWGGGGLGKDQQGRQEPVQVSQQVKRAGLGSSGQSSNEFKSKMTGLLKKFKIGEAKHDLVFASDFSKDERAAIHLIAQRFGLKSISYGKDENRQLVVCQKKTPWQIVKEVEDAGGSTDKYDLIPPENI